jgi:rare lipoprotein A
VNLQNGRHVRVRVIDRGPYVNGRILDLSYAAAERLGMVDGGVSVIQLEVIGDHRPDAALATGEPLPIRPSWLAVRRLDAVKRGPSASPVLDRPDPAVIPPHRLTPNDVLVQRRWRKTPSILAGDPANPDPASLVLV